MTGPIRPFTEPEERALAKLHGLRTYASLDITRDRPSTYRRLSDQGLAVVMQVHRQKRARLTATGRYFAALVAAQKGGVR